jgi:hypothetical protein
MSFWKRGNVADIQDPVLGVLSFVKPDAWKCRLPGGAPFAGDGPILYLPGSTAGPDPQIRELILAAIDRFPKICNAFVEPLYRLYTEHVSALDPEDLDPSFPRLTQTRDVLRAFDWIGVDVDQDGTPCYTFGFANSLDSTMFELRIGPGGEVSAENIGD